MNAKGERVLSATLSDTGDPAARLSAGDGISGRSHDAVSRISTARAEVLRYG